MLSNEELKRYQRQTQLPEIGITGQERLKKARVLCVGAGGLGSPLCLYLSACGIGNLGIIDGDKITLNNLHRQILFQSQDEGKAKVTQAKKSLQKINPNTKIKTYQEYLTEHNALTIFKDYDIIADCSDNFATRYLVNDACCELNKMNVYASVQQFQGQCSVFPGKNGPCYRCLFETVPEDIPNCAQAGVLGIVPGIIGTLQANEVLKLILQLENNLIGRLLVINTLRSSFKTFELPINPHCLICAKQTPFQQIPRPSLDCQQEQEMTAYALTAKDFLATINNNKITVIDVRNKEEFKSSSLNAINIPLSTLENKLQKLDPTQTYYLYCQSGPRSIKACEILKEAGFDSCFYLAGGLNAL